jgi:cysteine-rich repeat protein
LPNGELRCWGLNDNGQLGHDPSEYDNLGDASAETPATANSVVISDTTWFEIAAISPNFTCARASDERVYCWGKNSEGQLGRGDFTAVEYFDADELESVDVGTDSDAVKSLAVGDNFACVVVDYTNEVKCWGDDSVRQLGDGQTTNLNEPGPAVDLTHYAIKVAAGGSTACALLAVPGGDDSVRCWGEGSFGQLGDGGATDSADDTPSVITLDGNATDVSVGGLHVCAVVDGAVSCWGDNEAGKLGIAEATAQSDTPASAVQVEGETFVSVSAGLDHTCALTQSGNVYCWGSNASGQLGNGDSTELPETEEPTLIDFGEEGLGASEIASGSFHTCALLTNGRVRCWGEGSEGQLGQGSTDSLGDTEAVAAIADVQVIGPAPLCGNNVREGWETCDDGNTVNDNSCPSNCYSPCGDGIAFENEDCDDGNSDPNDGCTNDCKESFARVFVGGNNSYALSDDNLFKGWGAGEQAQYVPIAGYGSGWDPDLGTNLGDDESPSAHAIFLDFVFQNYTQHIYYGDYFAEVDEELTFDFVTTQSLTASDTHACAIGTNEAMYCWGYNDYGNLGLGSDLATPFPLRVKAGGKKAKQMGLGHTFTCALFDDHQVYCWGSNAYGQLGIDANDDALNLYLPSTPIVVDSIPSDANDVTIELLAVGGEHSCVKASNNKVYCWGRGEDFRLGTGDDSNRYEPDLDHPVNLGSGNVTALASGHYVSCALIESSGSTRVRCWGDNDNGLLGDSGATGTPGIGESFTVPGTPVKLVVGYAHACVLTSLGRVYCWGDNSVGQVMAGAAPSLDSPTQIDLGTDADGTPSTALDIGAGTAHNCIVASDHHIRCWGYSNLGQTGVGTETYGDENDEMELGFEHNVDVIGGDYDWWD